MRRAAMLIGVACVAGACLGAELRLHPVFDNHMVVQRGKRLEAEAAGKK